MPRREKRNRRDKSRPIHNGRANDRSRCRIDARHALHITRYSPASRREKAQSAILRLHSDVDPRRTTESRVKPCEPVLDARTMKKRDVVSLQLRDALNIHGNVHPLKSDDRRRDHTD